MSPITDYQRYKEIKQRSAEIQRIAALPRIDPVTGGENPWVVVTQADKDVKFLLDQISALQDEILHLEELLEQDDAYDDAEEPDEVD